MALEPCEPWADWADVTRCRDDLDTVSEVEQEAALAEASDLLFKMSGLRYPGACEVTRSPCTDCGCGRWLGMSRVRGCTPRERVDLRGSGRYPVLEVAEVIVRGETVSTADYRVDDWRWLVRLDAHAWPRCVDLRDPAEFSVRYTIGRSPGPSGRRAAAMLAAEIAALCVADAPCRLPFVVETVSREGVTYKVLDVSKMLDAGRTGLPLVDWWLSADATAQRAVPSGMTDPAATERLVTLDTGTTGS